MIINVNIHNLKTKEIVYSGPIPAEVTNSFVPKNITLVGKNEDGIEMKFDVQQFLSLKIPFKSNTLNLIFYTDGYLVLDKNGFMNYIIQSNTCYLNNGNIGNFGIDSFEPVEEMIEFIIKENFGSNSEETNRQL